MIVAAVLYFLVVVPFTVLLERFKPTPDGRRRRRTARTACRRSPEAATVCAFCTRDVEALPGSDAAVH